MGNRAKRALVVALAATALVAMTSCDRVLIVSRAASGGDANGHSGPSNALRVRGGVAIDGGGRVIAFESSATDLLPGGNAAGLFVRDLQTGTIERIGVGYNPDLTPDARYLVYADSVYGPGEVRRLDRQTGETIVVSVRPDGEPSRTDNSDVYNLNPSISDDGRYVAWESWSPDLVPGVVGWNVFARDLATGSTELVSRAADGGRANETSHTPAISGDGRFVAFSSWASNLTVGDTATGYREIYVRDRVAGTTVKGSIDAAGEPVDYAALNPSINRDGRFVTFEGGGTVWVRDLVAATSEAAAVLPDGTPAGGVVPTISGDGRMVLFASAAPLKKADKNKHLDVYVRDLVRHATSQVSVDSKGGQGTGDSDHRWMSPVISDDGHVAAFATEAALSRSDANGYRDVYVRAAWRPTISSVTPSTLAPGTTATVVVTGDGFLDGAGAAIDDPAAPGVHVTGVEVVSATEVRVQVSVSADAAVGPRSMTLWNRTAEPVVAASSVSPCVDCLAVA
ncbi:MAG: hypothetical protein R2702_14215 [Acidimicrobiales bacterium]